MHRVTFQQDEITYDTEEGQWLYDVCEAAGASVPFACKAGACGTCAMQVVQGAESLGPQRARGIRTPESNGLDPTQYRLLCLADVHGTLTLGASVNTQRATASLGVCTVRVEEYRPLTLTVCEQRFAIESGGKHLFSGPIHDLSCPRNRQRHSAVLLDFVASFRQDTFGDLRTSCFRWRLLELHSSSPPRGLYPGRRPLR